jgi:putative Holliday junction resolvase
VARILAIDYGTKRTGIAVTDPAQMIASGLTTISSHELIGFLKDYIGKEAVESLVIGYPRKMNNTDSEVLVYVKQFETAFKRIFPQIPVFWMDERFTSKIAMDAMVRGGMRKSRRRNKGNLDKISAAVILQDYLEQKRIRQ